MYTVRVYLGEKRVCSCYFECIDDCWDIVDYYESKGYVCTVGIIRPRKEGDSN